MFAAMMVASVLPPAVFPPVPVTKEMVVGKWKTAACSYSKALAKNVEFFNEYRADGTSIHQTYVDGKLNQTHRTEYEIKEGKIYGYSPAAQGRILRGVRIIRVMFGDRLFRATADGGTWGIDVRVK